MYTVYCLYLVAILDFERVSDTKKLQKHILKIYFLDVFHHVQYQMSTPIINFFHIWTPIPGLKWLRNNWSTTWYDLTPTGQRGKLYEKKKITFDFHILPEHRPIGGKIFPWRCISIKTAIIHEVGVDPFT